VLRRAPAPTWRRALAPAHARLGRAVHSRRQAAAVPTPAASPSRACSASACPPARPRAARARVGPLTRAPHGCAALASGSRGPPSPAARRPRASPRAPTEPPAARACSGANRAAAPRALHLRRCPAPAAAVSYYCLC
jgi:hypothetical protein